MGGTNMAIKDKFLEEAHVGLLVNLVGPKDVEGEIISLDTDTVKIKKNDSKIATIDLSTIKYYEIEELPVSLTSEATAESKPFLGNIKNSFPDSYSDASLISTNPSVNSISINAFSIEKHVFNSLEKAIIEGNVNTIKGLINNREYLYGFNYTDDIIDRIFKVINVTSLPSGNDYYSIACRLDGLQDNFNRSAEKYYWTVLSQKNISDSKKQKAVRKLHLYYIQEKNYSSYMALYSHYEKYIDLSIASFYTLHIQALLYIGTDISEIHNISIRFSRESDYIYLFNYLLANPDNYIAKKATHKLIYDFKFPKADTIALKYAFENEDADSFEELRIKLFVSLYPFYSIEHLQTLLAIGYSEDEISPTDEAGSTDETSGITNHELLNHEEIITHYLADTTFGLFRAITYAKCHNVESEILQRKTEEIRQFAENNWEMTFNNAEKTKKFYLLFLYGLIGVNKDIINIIKSSISNDTNIADDKTEQKSSVTDNNLYISTSVIPKVNHNNLEEAIIERNINNIVDLLKHKEYLYIYGYTDTIIDKMQKVIKNGSLPDGNDYYSVASRLNGLQNNLNRSAEEYYWKALSHKDTPPSKKQKAARQLLIYYANEKNYPSYLVLADLYKEHLDLSKVFLFTFHLEAMKYAGNDTADIQFDNVVFSSEGDYILLFKYLLKYPNNSIAEKAIAKLINEEQYLNADILALKYANSNNDTEYFENLRKQVFVSLYPFFSLEQLQALLSVGYKISETASDDEDSQKLNHENIIISYLEDTTFGIFRAISYAAEHNIESDTLKIKMEEVKQSAESEGEKTFDKIDDSSKYYLLYLYELIGVNDEILSNIRSSLRREKSELYDALVRYDAKKVNKIVSEVNTLKRLGYTEKEIKKFSNILSNKSYPQGTSDYETASRLYNWGFITQAMNYYIKVANEPLNEKRKNALNQIIGYATQTKNIDLFEKYYPMLDLKNKRNEVYLRFLIDCKYYHQEYKELYDYYVSNPTTTYPTIIYGALRYSTNNKEKDAIIDHACQLENFNYEFWMSYLKELINENIDEYRKIINKLLGEYINKFTANIDKCYEIICLDSFLAPPISDEYIKITTEDNYPLALPLIHYVKSKCSNEQLKGAILKNIIQKLNLSIEDMEYKYAHEIGSFAARYYPEDASLENIVRISGNGMDVYNMLPSGHDNYAKGKRLLMLGEDKDRAYNCFKKEIESSSDKNNIALCGMELIKGLNEAKRFEEVIYWGKILILEKNIFEYSALALDINNAFFVTNNMIGKKSFLDELIKKATFSIQTNDYQSAILQIKVIDIFDSNNAFVLRYRDLIETTTAKNINLDKNTYIGQANIIHYIEKDEEKYISFLVNGFKNNIIEENSKNVAATLLLESIINNDKIEDNMDFINNIGQYDIVLSEHIIDMLYSIVVSNNNIDFSIAYFSDLLNITEAEKRLPILKKLEKMYETALQNECGFETEFAVSQVLEYIQLNPSLQAKLCYIWLLAYAGNIESAGELLALIPEESEFSDDQISIIDNIVSKYFNGQKPNLSNKFEHLVKEKTLYRLVEHFKTYKDFISFSSKEEQIHAELIKNIYYKIDISKEEAKSALIKTIYGSPVRYKFWYLYFLCIKSDADPALLYCVNTNLVILNEDVTNDISKKQANYLLRSNPELSMRYSGYAQYNRFYRLYLMKAYQNNPSILNQIAKLSMNKKVFTTNLSIRKQLSEDYIHLFKLLDDRDDYIYIKSAMFIATNNHCEEYFYSLFKHDLLYREPIICIKMCIEMLLTGKGSKELLSNILNDLKATNTEYAAIISTLSNDIAYPRPVCLLLKDYPSLPDTDYINTILKQYQSDDPFAPILILETVDACYTDAYPIKMHLLALYRKSGSSIYYEKMYQIVLSLLKSTTSERLLYELCRMSVLLAVALGKNNRTTDVINIYEKYSFDKEYTNDLVTFCNVCELYNVSSDERYAKLFDALITGDWFSLFEKYNIGFLVNERHLKTLVDFSKMSFVQSIFNYISFLNEINSEGLEQFINDANNVIQLIFSGSVSNIIDKFLAEPLDEQKLFVSYMNLEKSIEPFALIPNDEDKIISLIHLWDIIYKRDYIINKLLHNMSKAPALWLLHRLTMSFYKSSKLLYVYIENLWNEKKYKEIIDLRYSFEWVTTDFSYVTYLGASLLLESDPYALEYVSKKDSEEYINTILLLKKKMLNLEIQKILTYAPKKKDITNLILSIVDSPNDKNLQKIVTEYSGENEIALLKLFYNQTNDVNLKTTLYEKYGDVIEDNKFITISTRSTNSSYPSISHPYYEPDINMNEFEKGPLTIKRCSYLEETFKDITLQEYTNGIPKKEKKHLSDLYRSLGSDISENVEYRKELLVKLAYVSSITNDITSYNDIVIKLGIVLYYSYFFTNIEKSRHILYETRHFYHKHTKRNTVELIRKTICEALGSYTAISEIMDDKTAMIECLNRVLKISMSKDFSLFFTRIIETTEKISDVLSISDISQRAGNYQKLSGILKTLVARNNKSPLFEQVYLKWYKMIISEIKKLSKGAVLNLEIETIQCSSRGKICCIIQNMGKKPAENISIRAIFEDAIRCKDNEKEIKILYGGDTSVFAFNIRCKEEGVQKYKIEISYEISQNIEQLDYSHEIRIVKETGYKHIGNLYSVAPVTNNADFYGREREKEKIISFLNDTKYNTSMVMHGLKRVGKTSMLRFIERTMKDSDIYIPVYVSAQQIGEQNAVKKMFVETIVDQLESIGCADVKCRSYLEYDYDKNPEQLYDFYKYLQKSRIMGDKRILFMADEIEELFDMVDEGIINRRLYKVLRVILQELTSIRFIFCGADHLTDILYNHALADIFEITKRIIISRLDEESMYRMITEPAKDKLSYTERAKERIWYYTKGHTFYTKQICSKVIDLLNEESRVTAYAYDIDIAVKQIMRITEYFIYLSRFFNENDKQVIKILCDNTKFSKDHVSEDVLEEKYEGRGLYDSLMSLEFKDILNKTEGYDTNFYQFSIEMFRLWYSKAEYTTELTKEDS